MAIIMIHNSVLHCKCFGENVGNYRVYHITVFSIRFDRHAPGYSAARAAAAMNQLCYLEREMNNAAPVVSGPITKELAATPSQAPRRIT